MPTYTVRELIEMRVGPALAAADPCNDVNGLVHADAARRRDAISFGPRGTVGTHQQHK
jgi:hypothetical protein